MAWQHIGTVEVGSTAGITPTWESNFDSTAPDGDEIWGKFHDQNIEDFTTYANQCEADANWVPQTCDDVVVVACDHLNFDHNSSTDRTIYYDMGKCTVPQTGWVLRFKARKIANGAGTNAWNYYGISSTVGHANTTQDWIGYVHENQSGECVHAGLANGTTLTTATGSDPTTLCTATDYWIEIKRQSCVSHSTEVFSCSNYRTSVAYHDGDTAAASICGLRYMKFTGWPSGVTGDNHDRMDDIQFWSNHLKCAPQSWQETGTKNVIDYTCNTLDFCFDNDATNHKIVYDLGEGTMSDDRWTLRFKFNVGATLVAGSTIGIGYIGFIDTDNTVSVTSSSNTALYFELGSCGIFRFKSATLSNLNTGATEHNFTDDCVVAACKTSYIELKKTGGTSGIANVYSCEDYADLIESSAVQTTNCTDGLRYFFVGTYNSSTSDSTFNGTIEDIKFWNDPAPTSVEEMVVVNSLRCTTADAICSTLCPTFSDDFTGYATQCAADCAWCPASATSDVDIYHAKLDFTYSTASVNEEITHDLGACVTNNDWVLRWKINFSTLSASCNSVMGVGISSTTTGSDTVEDGVYLCFTHASTTKRFRSAVLNGATYNNTCGSPTYTTINEEDVAINTDYYVELKRSGCTLTTAIYTDSDYTQSRFVHGDASISCVTGARYIKVINYNAVNNGNLTGTVDDVKFYCNPCHGWAQTGWKNDPSVDQVRYNFNRESETHGATYDLGACGVDDCQWVLRWEMVHSGCGNCTYGFVGIADSAHCVTPNTGSQDVITASFAGSGGSRQSRTQWANCGTFNDNSGTYNSTDCGGCNETYWHELKKTSCSTFQYNIYNCQEYKDLKSQENRTAVTATGLRYIHVKTWSSANGGSYYGIVKNMKFWNATGVAEKTMGRHIMFKAHTVHSGLAQPVLQFNDDQTVSYATRGSFCDGGDCLTTFDCQVGINIWKNSDREHWSSGTIINIPCKQKLTIVEGQNITNNAATAAPDRYEFHGKWTNSTQDIGRIRIKDDGGSGCMDYGSRFSVWGTC